MKRRGFTLIELLVVLAIIGILSSIIVVAYNGVQERSRDAKRKSDLQAIANGLGLYYTDNKAYPMGASTSAGYILSNVASLNCTPTGGVRYQLACLFKGQTSGSGGYMNEIPVDPRDNTWSYIYIGTKTGYKVTTDTQSGRDAFETGNSGTACQQRAAEYFNPVAGLGCTSLQVHSPATSANWSATSYN